MSYIILIATLCFTPNECIEVSVYDWEVTALEVQEAVTECREHAAYLEATKGLVARCHVWE